MTAPPAGLDNAELDALADYLTRAAANANAADQARADLQRDHPQLLGHFDRLLRADQASSPLDLPLFREDQAPAAAWPPGHRVGPWRIDALAGRGGMGEVYRASRADGAFERTVAIKRVVVESADFYARFERERALLARLDHPAIARLLDGGLEATGRPFLVMEWVDGVGLAEWLQQPQSLNQRLDLLEGLAAALIAAHRSLVVHRDLKPANVRVTAANQPKLLDFGIAKLLDGGPAHAGTTVGLFSPLYAAPEQLTGAPPSVPTDVHGFGLLMHEVLSGQVAFPAAANSLADAVRVICEQTPALTSVAAKASDLPYPPRLLAGDLDAIVGRCLAKDPAARYPGMPEVLADIQHYRQHRPIQARHGRWRYRGGRWLRRNWLPAVLGGLAAVALLLGLLGTLWQARIATSERDQARSEVAMQDALREHFILVLNEAAGTDGASVREVLDASIVGIAEQYPKAPALREDLTLALADVYYTIGDFVTARRLLAPLRVSPAGPGSDLRRIKVGLQLALVLIPLGELDAADQALQQAEAQVAKVPTARALSAEIVLARAQWWRAKGDIARGLGLQQRALAALRLAPEVTPRALATQTANLAMAYLQDGQLAAAETENQRALAIFREAALPLNSDLPVVLTNLGHLAALRGQPKIALDRYDQALAATLRSATRTPAHAALLNARARVLLTLDRAGEALPLARQAETILRERTGAQSPNRLGVLITLADIALATADLAGAQSNLETAQAIALAKLPPNHPLRLRLDLSWAMRQRADGENAALTAEFQRLGGALARGPAPLKLSAARAEIILAEMRASAGASKDAITALQRALGLLEPLQPAHGVDRLEAACWLAVLQKEQVAVAAHCLRLREILGARHSQWTRMAASMAALGGQPPM